MVLVGETGDGQEVLDRAVGADWDVLVLDLSLDGVGGTEVLRRLREMVPRLPVIVLSMYSEAQYGPRILKMGASAYLSKGRSSDELLKAIREAHAGRRYVTPAVADALLIGVGQGAEPPHERLTEREHQVFLLVARGRTPGEIALELSISGSTVSSHLLRVREKLGVSTNGEIIQYAYRAGVADPRT